MKFKWDTDPKQDRFDPKDLGKVMKAVVTVGNGGYDKLQCRVVNLPTLERGEVLLQVLAAGVNNTEINTRIGWYSSSVTTGTEDAATAEGQQATKKADGGWNETTPFPFIQGTDCCGRIVAVAPGGDKSSIGSRVLVRACMRQSGFGSMDNIWMGSDFDGAFAQFGQSSHRRGVRRGTAIGAMPSWELSLVPTETAEKTWFIVARYARGSMFWSQERLEVSDQLLCNW